MDKTYVLDTSALLALIQDEAGAGHVEKILQSAQRKKVKAFISFASIAELYYITWQEEGESAAKELVVHVKSLPIQVVESVERTTLIAGRIKANHRLSFADAFIAATAVHTNGVLVHKDPEFESLHKEIRLDTLPYK